MPENGQSLPGERAPKSATPQPVFVLPAGVPASHLNSGIDAGEIWRALWAARLAVAAAVLGSIIIAVIYGLLATVWYRAEVLLSPAADDVSSSILSQISGLGGLGFPAPAGSAATVEALAVLQSRDFARAFIEEYGLQQSFFSDHWDKERGQWREKDIERQPDVRDAVKYFHDHVLRVTQGRQNALVTLAVEWTDADTAAQWANALADRLNERMRERALQEAEQNVAYLRSEMAAANIVTMQQSIGKLLEVELQRLMLARGNPEFAFRVVDAASAPKYPVRPKRLLIVVLAALLGGVLGIGGALVAYATRRQPSESSG